jgi:chaperone required for assembly of F1-ATPase
MKRFYKEAAIVPGQAGVAIALDARPVKTPARAPLILPTEELAEAIAEEWNKQGDEIDPRAMPLTGLANAAIDRVAPDPAAFADGLSAYGQTDLVCYRADSPQPLVERQAAYWDPLIDWARRRYGVDFNLAVGVMHRPQPPETVKRLALEMRARDPFRLAAMSPLVTISGSLVIALALAEGELRLGDAWAASTLDEAWQAEQWGEDAVAAQAIAARRKDFEAGYRLLTLL